MARSIRTVLVAFTFQALLGATTTDNRPLTVGVSVINRGYANREIVHAATDGARGIFRQAGIEMGFVVVDPLASRVDAPKPAAFHIVLSDQRSPAKHVLGAADITEQTAWVLVRNIRETAQDTRTDEATVLAHVVAHELGHLLLGSPEHSVSGVMTDPMDFTLAEQGGLRFHVEQIRRMRQRLVSPEP